MKKDVFVKYHPVQEDDYVGKHAKKLYLVSRVTGPAGKEEVFYIYGLDDARDAVLGYWDYSIVNMKGEEIL